MSEILEHDQEAAPGLPAELPDDERVLWRGGPDWWMLARSKFHVLKLAAYFAAILLVHLAVQLGSGVAFTEALGSVAVYALLAAFTLGLIVLFARLTAKATLFTLTSRRVVIRCGVALPLSMNLPFCRIESANVRDLGAATGDIALRPVEGSRASYVLLWPYVRAWHFARVEPTLRAIPDVSRVAGILSEALQSEGSRVGAVDPDPAPAAVPEATTAGKRRWQPYPTVPLAAACGLVVIALIVTSLASLTRDEESRAYVAGDVVASVDLYFEDSDDGSVQVVDASRNQVLDRIQPGENGFLRSTVRGLARARMARDASDEAPFSLLQTAEGRLLLTDPVTDRIVDLWAFGDTNARPFLRYLPAADDRPSAGAALETAPGEQSALTAAAQTNEEAIQ